MAFTVQQDDPVAGANSYITVSEFKAYHKDRGTDISSFGTGDIEKAAIRATDYLDGRFTFVGERSQNDQTTQWPRQNALDRESFSISGIPVEVKEATHEYGFIALSQALNPSPTQDALGQTVQRKKEVVGPIEESTTYTGGASTALPKYPIADSKLTRRGLVISSRDLVRA